MIDYREIKFEEAIEHYLTHSGGYSKADPKNFDPALALDPTIDRKSTRLNSSH